MSMGGTRAAPGARGAGLRRFAGYALAPNERGYCGPAVVRAYWLGGNLLDAVDPAVCTDVLLAAFAGAATVDPRRLHATREIASPHHLFHVLVTYPWIDLVAAGRYEAVARLDACRVRVGTVLEVGGGVTGAVRVASQPLVAGPHGLALGEEVREVVRPLDRPDAPVLSPGDAVALHYDLLCDRLTSGEVSELDDRSAITLAAVNRCLLGR